LANICVIGLGRIGLALSLALAEVNHTVIGVDKNAVLLSRINQINPKFDDDKINALLTKHLGKSFKVTENLDYALSISKAVFITVNTSVTADGNPNLFPFWDLIYSIMGSPEFIQPRLYIIKSTVPIGTTRLVAQHMEEKTKLKCGKDFFLSYSPERVLGNKALMEIASLPKIIGAYDKNSYEKTAEICQTLGGKIIEVESPETAELIKLADNSYRQTLFAFANDLALIAEQKGINVYSMIEAANESYPRNNIPNPSGGVSGLCLTKDPLYLENGFKTIAQERGFSSVWYSARKSNNYMPYHVINLLKKKLNEFGKELDETKIVICGIAYKENIDDFRLSHGVEMAKILRSDGINVLIWDPCVSDKPSEFIKINEPFQTLNETDGLIFTVKHTQFQALQNNNQVLDMLKKMRTPIIIDCCGLFQKLNLDEKSYVCVGKPCKADVSSIKALTRIS
jgi:UDP-N-acetyl-D-mannosaminuronic acid dehydrogenase